MTERPADPNPHRRPGRNEEVLDAYRSGESVILNCYGEQFELTPAEADELGQQLIYAAARARE